MNESNFSVNPEIVILKLSSRISDMSVQIALLESVVDSLKEQILEMETQNGLT